MIQLNRNMSGKVFPELPERIIQFGEGVFLRAFVDWMVHEMNQKKNCGNDGKASHKKCRVKEKGITSQASLPTCPCYPARSATPAQTREGVPPQQKRKKHQKISQLRK